MGSFRPRIRAMFLCLLVFAAWRPMDARAQYLPATNPNPQTVPGQEPADKDGAGKDGDGTDSRPPTPPEWWTLHGQATVVSQGNWPFRSPYFGPNSLLPNLNYRTTETTTLFFTGRVLPGSEIIFNPEVASGGGISSTTGIAGFPNGEAVRTGIPQPTPYFARLYWKQTVGFGGEQEEIADGPNQVPGLVDVDRLTIRLGKMAATDFFDDNAYSHDPRTQFLNWSIMYNGAWDYPANVRGYTYGGVAELNRKNWSLRYGAFAEPAVANGSTIDPHIDRALGHALEYERRYSIFGRPGSTALLAYLNFAHMGSYREALALMPINPQIALTRDYRPKQGFGLSTEQEVADGIGFFARAGWNNGQTESWAFTEIDRTLTCGLQFAGSRWRRPDDRFGMAVVFNGLSNAHRDYLAAGGLGFIIGDGRLNYGLEEIAELYYNWSIKPRLILSLDLQGVNHPAYNRDRGPVGIAGIRFHYDF
jgi:high affinity Mn2+ porin